MTEQLVLFEPVKHPVVMVQMCHRCGAELAGVEVADAADPWMAAVLWGYIELKRHEREDCPKVAR